MSACAKEHRRRKGRINSRQISVLVGFLYENRELLGRPPSPRAAALHESKWQHVASLLNSAGTQKTVPQWKTCWRDLKRNARARMCSYRRGWEEGSTNLLPPPTEADAKIMEILGEEPLPIRQDVTIKEQMVVKSPNQEPSSFAPADFSEGEDAFEESERSSPVIKVESPDETPNHIPVERPTQPAQRLSYPPPCPEFTNTAIQEMFEKIEENQRQTTEALRAIRDAICPNLKTIASSLERIAFILEERLKNN